MRTVFRAIMFILQIPLWLTAFSALGSGMMDDYDGDRLWLPTVGTFATFAMLGFIIAWPFETAWEIIRGRG